MMKMSVLFIVQGNEELASFSSLVGIELGLRRQVMTMNTYETHGDGLGADYFVDFGTNGCVFFMVIDTMEVWRFKSYLMCTW